MFARVKQKTENARQNKDEKQQFSMGNFHFFGRRKTTFFGGGYNFKTG